MEAFSLKKVTKMLQGVVVSWQKNRWNVVDEAKRHNPIHSAFEVLVDGDVQPSIVMEYNWALSVDQCWLQALQFSVYLISLQSMLLRCKGFSRIQKAVVDQTGRRSPNSDHDLLLVKIWLFGSAFELLLSPNTELVISSSHIKSTFI